jgi:hypothetical protein
LILLAIGQFSLLTGLRTFWFLALIVVIDATDDTVVVVVDVMK